MNSTIVFPKRPLNRPLVPKPSAPLGRVPRVAKLLALAIRFQGLIDQGIVEDYSTLARLAKVSQPRITQIMNLLNLAPDIQEAILFLPRVVEGKTPIHEKLLRPITAELEWKGQREMWSKMDVVNKPLNAVF